MSRFALLGLAALLSACSQHRAVHPAVPSGLSQPGVSVPGMRQAMQRQVRNAVEAGDGDIETRRLQTELAQNPKDLATRQRLAAHYEQMGSPELALDHRRIAAEQFPDDARLTLDVAIDLNKLDLTSQAIDALGGFLGRHPEAPAEMYSWHGIFLDFEDRFEEGEKSHRRALGLSPLASFHNNLGQNLLRQERSAEAAAEFRAALQLEPRSEVARNNLGLALARSGPEHASEAVLHWQSVSGPATAHSNLAAVLMERGQYQEARRELNIALGYTPNHPAALKNLVLLSERDGLPATLPAAGAAKAPAKPGLWSRLGSAFRKLMVEEPVDPAKKSATRAQARPPAEPAR